MKLKYFLLTITLFLFPLQAMSAFNGGTWHDATYGSNYKASQANYNLALKYNNSPLTFPKTTPKPGTLVRPIGFGKANIRELFRARNLVNPLGALAGIGAGALINYLFDPSTGAVVKPGYQYPPYPGLGHCNAGNRYNITISECFDNHVSACPGEWYCPVSTQYVPSSGAHNLVRTNDPSHKVVRWNPNVHPGQQRYDNNPSPSQPLSDQEFFDDIAPLFTPQDIMSDAPYTSSTPGSNPIIQQKITNEGDNINIQYGDSTTTNNSSSSTTTTTDNGDGTTTTTGTEDGTTEWPAFCSWASIMCSMAEYIMAPPVLPEESLLPVEDVPTPNDFVVAGGSSCPVPQVLDVYGAQISYDLTPLCTFMIAMNPFVIALSLFGSALILIGARN